jgi:hypothetical protein
LLSIVFGRALREAAANVRAASRKADRALFRARRLIETGEDIEAEAPRGPRIDAELVDVDERTGRDDEARERSDANPDDAAFAEEEASRGQRPRSTRA